MLIKVLGPIEVDGGEPIALGGPSQRRVLAYLALHAGDAVSLDRLVDITWEPDRLPRRAEHNMQSYIHRLRSALGEFGERIETAGTSYRLCLEPGELDLWAFDESVALARRAFESGDATGALEAADRADSLWRGAPFGEFAGDSWASAEVGRLTEAVAGLAEARCAALLSLRRPDAAVAVIEPVIAEHPLRERPRALLMRALYESGRQAEALRAFQHFRGDLADEVGLEPSSDLVDLDRQIASGTVEPSFDRPDVSSAYEIEELIGQGAFARVYRARQRALDRFVAVKMIRAELANQPVFIQRFEAEAQMVARIEHPNVVALYDYWREPDRAFLVMRWMTGGSLEQRLDRGPLTLEETVELVDQIGAGLDAAHRQGIVHRDVKPENILFDDEGHAVISDFGIALETADFDRPESALSEGSPIFAAPEQLRREPAALEADVFALAVVAFVALSGSPPFTDTTNAAERLRRQLEEPIPTLASRNTAVPLAVDDVLARATAKSPDDRFSSVLAFAAAFGAAATGEQPPSARMIQRGENPYKGLRAFEEGDASDFFGRDRLTRTLLDRIAGGAPALALVGPSGCGKSSVVRAGLLPALRRQRRPVFITTMVPGRDPYESLETALLRIAVNPPSELLDQLTDGPRGILRAVKRVLPDDAARLVLVIDQFEELYTNLSDSGRRSAFLDALCVAVNEPGSPVQLLLTLRADFYDKPLRHGPFAQLLTEYTVPIPPLAPDELEHAIVSPAARAGTAFEPGVVARIIADLAGESGALPLLQHAMARSFDQSGSSTITLDDYEAIGGVAGALAAHAEATWAAGDVAEQSATRRLFARLVVPGDEVEHTARRALLTEVATGTDASAAIDRLTSARLLTLDRHPSSREPTVEVAHEALLREWPRLRRWIDEDREAINLHRHLTDAATAWDQRGREPSELYRGGRLEAAEAVVLGHGLAIGEVERAFLDASTELRREAQEAEWAALAAEQRSNRRLRRLLASVAVLLVLAIVAGSLAFQQRQVANEAAFDAETGRLVAEAQSLAVDNPRVSMLLAVAAHQRESSPETLGALQVALSRSSPLLGILGYGTDYLDVAWLANGWLAGLHAGGLDLFDPGTGRLLDQAPFEVVAPPAPFHRYRLVTTESGEIVVARTADEILVFSTAEGTLAEQSRWTEPAPISSIGTGPDGRLLIGRFDQALSIKSVDGESLLELSFPRSANLYEQAVPYLGEGFPAGDAFAELPVDVKGFGSDDELFVSVGSALYRYDWDGQPLDETFTVMNAGPSLGNLPTAGFNDVGRTGDRLVALARSSVAILESDRPWESVTPAVLVPVAFGGENPDVIGLLATDGDHATVSMENGVVRSIQMATGDSEVILDLDAAVSNEVMADNDGHRVAVASANGIRLLSLLGSSPIAEAIERQPMTNLVSISVDGRSVAMSPNAVAGPLTLWHRYGNGQFQPLVPPETEGLLMGFGIGPVDQLRVFSLSGVSSTYDVTDSSIRLKHAWSGAPADPAGDPSPDERWIALGDNGVQIWEPLGSTPIVELVIPASVEPEALVTGLRFSPDGDRLLAAWSTGQSQVWDTATWQPILEDVIRAENIAIGFWSQDGSLLATASTDGTVTVRNGETIESIRTLVGSLGANNVWRNGGGLLFSADNSTLLTNIAGPGRLWDVATGRQIGSTFPNADTVHPGSNLGEALHLVTASDTAALVWNLDMATWPEIACRAAGSNLSENEWEQWGPRDEPFREVCPAPAA